MRPDVHSTNHQIQFWKLILGIGIFLLVSLACNLPTSLPVANPFDQEEFVDTSVAETLVNMEINQTPGGIITGTQTPENISSPEPTGESSPTPGEVRVFLSENTNCRTGQGTSFERLTIVYQGEEVDAVGVDTSGNYWYVRMPDQPTDFCWLWANYATPTGPYESLPVFTPIPTPTPGFDFQISYDSNLGNCGGFHYLQYRITNTGSVTLESWRTTSVDHTGGSIPLANQQDSFIRNTGCTQVGTMLKLEPGEVYYLNAMFTNDPVGHDLTVTAQICNENGLGGGCISRQISHTP